MITVEKGTNPSRAVSGSAVTNAVESGGKNTRRYTPTRQTALKYSGLLSANSAEKKSKWYPPETTELSSAVASTNESTGNMTISVITQVEAERIRA